MRKFVSRERVLVGGAALALCLCLGCKAKMGKYTLRVQPDASLAGKSIEVHLVGVNATDYPKWHDYSMTSYWKHDDPLRATAVGNKTARVLRFGQGLPNVQSVDINDPIFKEWQSRKVEHLFILTNLVSTGTDKPGTADFRRGILPLTTKHWDRGEIRKQKGIAVTITASGPDVKPQPKVKK